MNHTPISWGLGIGRDLQRVYRSGVEGLPQPVAAEFGRAWAEFCGCKHGLMVAHGTDALRLGLAVVLEQDGFEYGGEVIVPNFSFIASAIAPLEQRLGVVFVDVDPDTLLIDPAQVEAAIVPGRTRAILPVHLFGQPADMTSLRAIASRHGLRIVEDAAQAHGAAWGDRPVGSWGDVGAFSFQSTKNLSCGEGGALVTNDTELYERAYAMHNVGRPLGGGKRWEHETLGWNCRPTEYQAALLLHRLKSFEAMQARRSRNAAVLSEMLGEVRSLAPLGVHPQVRSHGHYLFAMRYQPEWCGDLPIQAFIEHVRGEGIPIMRSYPFTLADQPVIRTLRKKHPDYFRALPTPVSDRATQDLVCLPQHVFLGSKSEIEDVVAAVRKVERRYQ